MALVSVAIVPELTAPAAAGRIAGAGVRGAAADHAAVGQRRDRAGVGHAGASDAGSAQCAAAADRAADFVDQRRDRASVGCAGATDRSAGGSTCVAAADRAADIVVRLLIFAPVSLDCPGAPGRDAVMRESACAAAADRAAVVERHDRAGVGNADAARGRIGGGEGRALASVDRAADGVGQHFDRAGVCCAGAAGPIAAAGGCGAAADRAAVVERRDRAGVGNAGASDAGHG